MGGTRGAGRCTGAAAAAATLLLALPALAQAANEHATHPAIAAGRWSLLIALGVLVVGPTILIGLSVLASWLWRWARWFFGAREGSHPRGGRVLWPWDILHKLFVGHDNRISTSKTVATVWTYSVAGALLSLAIAKWIGHGYALFSQEHKGLQSNYGLLIGGPLGAAILAKAVVGGQVEDKPGSKAGGTPAASQLVANDQGDTDLGDLQYVLFNAVALIFFYGELLRAPYLGLPDLPDLLVGLTSVSAVGYVGKKVLPTTTLAITSVRPQKALPGEQVEIAGPGLVSAREHARSVSFGDLPAAAVAFGHTARGPFTRATVPADAPPGDVDLHLTTHDGVVVTWSGFEILPVPPPPPPPAPPAPAP
ncbi:MAG TPA: hypothetical protein VFV85_04750, partial [Conexibacter sp.]|nr:hypothetical protein [Conexibacter sp.]